MKERTQLPIDFFVALILVFLLALRVASAASVIEEPVSDIEPIVVDTTSTTTTTIDAAPVVDRAVEAAVVEVGFKQDVALRYLEDIHQNQMKVSVFGTEYVVGDDGRIFVQLISPDQSTTINNASCFATIFKPDNSLWLSGVSMSSLGSEGLYYYDLPNLTAIGVYMTSIWCSIPYLEKNVTTSLLASDNFDSKSECGGTGFTGLWKFPGSLVWGAFQDELGLTEDIPDNFVLVAGTLGSSYVTTTSFLIKHPPESAVNFLRFRLYDSFGTPYNNAFIYNFSICPTSVENFTANSTFGADCSSSPVVLKVENLTCSLNAFGLDNYAKVLFTPYNMSSSNKYIMSFSYVSGSVNTSSAFWRVRAKGPPSPPSDIYYRRVFNTSLAQIYSTLMDLHLYRVPAHYEVVSSAHCFSGSSCIEFDGIEGSGSLQRYIDASGAESLNISFYSYLNLFQIGDTMSVRYWDGTTWKTLLDFVQGQSHNWTARNLELSVADYDFGPNNLISFDFVTLGDSFADFRVDNLTITKSGIQNYYFANDTEYQFGRGASEVHVSPSLVAANNTAIEAAASNISILKFLFWLLVLAVGIWLLWRMFR
jgi:hypothetical protein